MSSRRSRGDYRKKDNYRRRRSRPRRDESDGSSSATAAPSGKHPRHLKGKAIGLWYAANSKGKRAADNGPRMVGTVALSEKKRCQLKGLLDQTSHNLKKESSFFDEENLEFQMDFLALIHGSIDQKIFTATFVERNEALDEVYKKEYMNKFADIHYQKMLKKRHDLPAYKMKEEILSMIEANQVIIISGETGCGKTTQVAQFILDHYLEKGKGSICKVVCTQPRRISAISVAERVADERAESIGNSVGYQIRLEKIKPRDRGSIIFCTTGVILQQMHSDVCLKNVSHLILDEIHERDVLSDFLIGLIHKIVKHRKNIKVILMSATLNAKKFAGYFGVDSIIEIPGFTYEVKEYYLEDVLVRTGFTFPPPYKPNTTQKYKELADFNDFIMPHIRKLQQDRQYPYYVCQELMKKSSEDVNLELILELIIHICTKEKDPGAILVFLTGYADISSLNKLMEESKNFPSHKYLIIPLHSQMPSIEQKHIFNPPPNGVRKIILSTNIAETSITIDDVVFVIDCGKIKMTNFNVELNQQTLFPEWVSIANANQRRGRAGRVKPGVCFHLFTKARLMFLDSYQKPEILRKRLEDVILQLKILQLGKAKDFLNTLMDPPKEEAVDLSLDLLVRLNAIDDDEFLTPLGYHLARLPMSPQMGKMALLASIFSCLDPILSVAASLDFKDPFQMPLGMEKKVDKKKLDLAGGIKSDHILVHEALRMFEDCHNQRQFCWENFLSQSTLKLLQNMKKQFAEYLHQLNFITNKSPHAPENNINSNNISLIKAIICAGLYPNVILNRFKVTKSSLLNLFYTMNGKKVQLHPKSILRYVQKFDSPILVYYLKIKSTADFVHDATMVHPLSLLFFGDKFARYMHNGRHSISINDSIGFKCSESTYDIINELRKRLNKFLEDKVSRPGWVDWNDENEVCMLKAVMELITTEDEGDIDMDMFDSN